MPVRSIVVVPHGALDVKAEEVANIDEQIRKLALDMADTMYKAPGVGLAANQVGRTATAHRGRRGISSNVEPQNKKKEPLFIINPVVCSSEGEVCKEEKAA